MVVIEDIIQQIERWYHYIIYTVPIFTSPLNLFPVGHINW